MTMSIDTRPVNLDQQPCGRVTFDGASCQYGEDIKPGDLVAANLDVKDVCTGGGLYLIEERANGRVVWRGCRRMMRTAEGICIDLRGNGEWATYRSLEQVGWHVVGVVEIVYKPTRYQ